MKWELLENIIDQKIISKQAVTGGDINAAYKLETPQGFLFLKHNSALKYPGIFEEEAKALNTYFTTGVVEVPKVLMSDVVENEAFLLLEWIEEGTPNKNTHYKLGQDLAKLHQCTSKSFGWTSNNYLGTVIQENEEKETWGEFFVENRIEPFIKKLKDSSLLSKKVSDRFLERMSTFFPDEKPSLLHGDLWQGNYRINEKGIALLIDPAVYFGHREIDIAMTRMFGGFPSNFYRGYQEEHPLEYDWEDRIEVAQFIPVLIHAILFGGAYVQQVENILSKY